MKRHSRTPHVVLSVALLLTAMDLISQEIQTPGSSPGPQPHLRPPSTPAPRIETLTNADIISLAASGISQALIADKIRSAHATAFDTSVESIKSLKAAGISDDVIHAMIESSESPAAYSNSDDPALLHQPGIYAQFMTHDGQAHLVLLEHTTAMGVGSHNGAGGAMESMGAASQIAEAGAMVAGPVGLPILMGANFVQMLSGHKGKAHFTTPINGPRAPVQIDDPNPTFYVYVREDAQRFGGSEFSVRDFELVHLHPTSTTREVEIATSKGTYGEEPPKIGFDPKALENISVQKIKPGVYQIKLVRPPLKPGEYAFEHLMDGVFYDFGVNGAR